VSWVCHFRLHCVPFFPLNYFRAPRLPKDARIVIFPGGLHPEHAIAGGWRRRPGEGGLAHIMGMGKRGKNESPFSYLRHYMKPAEWVEQHWRE